MDIEESSSNRPDIADDLNIRDDLDIDDEKFSIDPTIVNISKLQERIDIYKISRGVRNTMVTNIFLLGIVTKMYIKLINSTSSIYSLYATEVKDTVNSYSYYKSCWVYLTGGISVVDYVVNMLSIYISKYISKKILDIHNKLTNTLFLILYVLGNNLFFTSLYTSRYNLDDILLLVNLILGYQYFIKYILLNRETEEDCSITLSSIINLQEVINKKNNEIKLYINRVKSRIEESLYNYEEYDIIDEDEDEDEDYIVDGDYRDSDNSNESDHSSNSNCINVHVNDIVDLFTYKLRDNLNISDEDELIQDDTTNILIKYKTILKDDSNCIICHEKYKDGELVTNLKCNHHYHCKCIKEWVTVNSNCPMCKRDIIYEDSVN